MNTARTLTPSPDAPVYSPAVIEASLDGLRARIDADHEAAADDRAVPCSPQMRAALDALDRDPAYLRAEAERLFVEECEASERGDDVLAVDLLNQGHALTQRAAKIEWARADAAAIMRVAA
jgi:hypothetical protein